MERLKQAWFMLLELLMRVVINPYLRARLLRLCGATIGRNVRIYEVQFLNLRRGFRNLSVDDDVHIGMGCRLDLEGAIVIHRGATLSPGVTVLTHADPGSHQRSPICRDFPPLVGAVEIGEYCWVGANTTILPDVAIGNQTVVGACSLVKGRVDAEAVYVGTPARKTRQLRSATETAR